MALMKAIRMHRYGGSEALTLDEVPRPVPQENEVLLRVRALSVNPVDWKIREGFLKEVRSVPLPSIPGADVAGIVESIGAGVARFRQGHEVFGLLRSGGYAEYATAPVDALVSKPRSLDFSEAASVPLASMTAWQALVDHGGVGAGKRVLIHGAAGGVGLFAVQLARWKNAEVIGTASAPDLEFVRGLGAMEAIDYKATRFEDVVEGVDVVLDLIGGETQQRSFQALRPGGILVATSSPPSQELAKRHRVRALMMFMQPSTAILKQIGELLDAGRIKTHVGKVFSLAETRQAQELSQHGHVQGKIVLRVD
jgi:NADPH:quinone reductase-like Zn-dependent oxidoreductase